MSNEPAPSDRWLFTPEHPVPFVRRAPPGLLAALAVTLLFHGGLLIAGSFQRTYDAWIHVFFADHYRRGWFQTWEPRWYTGFKVVTYPPGAHQMVAALSFLIGLTSAFQFVQLGALLLFAVGVYRWSRIWVDDRTAGWAALLGVASSSIAETVHVFGQLPTTLALGFLLNSLPSVDRWLRRGRVRDLVTAVVLTAATTACHHVTTLFGCFFFAAPVLARALLDDFRTPLPGEPFGHPVAIDRSNVLAVLNRRFRRILRPLLRTCVYGVLILTSLVVVVLPYWLQSKADPITQVPIPHASRDSFIANPNAGLVFWLIPWGLQLLVLPYVALVGLRRRPWPLAASVLMLFLLGTGGTTPIPRLLLGSAFDILTLDRFTFWATISILPFTAMFVNSIAQGRTRKWMRANLSGVLTATVQVVLAVAYVAMAVFSAGLTRYRPFQPAAIDMGPIVNFIEKDEHWRWRYLTLGFGDQMAWLSAQTTAQTVDGNYHSARRLPELTTEPVERLEGAKFSGVQGIGSLQQFMAVPERYHLKYVFSNDHFYDPLLAFSGWHQLPTLEDGIAVWEREDVSPIPVALVDNESPMWERLAWGILPPAAIAGAFALLLFRAIGEPIPGFVLRARRRMGARSPHQRLLGRLDRRLERSVSKLSGEATVPRWQKWQKPIAKASTLLFRAPRPTRRRLQIGIVVLVGAALLWRPTVTDGSAPPIAAVTTYLNRLDLRDFAGAYAMLDPATRPSLDLYRQGQLRDGGLVASFSKLKSVREVSTEIDGDQATVNVSVDYLTALRDYTVPEKIILRDAGKGWTLEADQGDLRIPPDEFLSRPGVRFLRAGRRQLTDATTANTDILDRPRLSITSARLTIARGRWVVVGEVTNVDVDPADVTVTAQLRDHDGATIAGWNASQVINHRLLPGESTPFRVDFEGKVPTGVTGLPNRTYDPDAFIPLVLEPGQKVSSADVYAKAVVTPEADQPDLQLLGLRIVDEGGLRYLEGTVRNDGVTEVAIPHVLLTYRDKDGNPAYVDHSYLPSSIAPQRSQDFRIALVDTATISPSQIKVVRYDNALSQGSERDAVRAAPPAQLTLDGPFPTLSITIGGYTRAPA
jgi:hypothetical protein